MKQTQMKFEYGLKHLNFREESVWKFLSAVRSIYFALVNNVFTNFIDICLVGIKVENYIK